MNDFKAKVLSLIKEKIESVENLLPKFHSLIEYEMKVIIFVSALNSWRFDSLLRPYPSDFFNLNNEKDFKMLNKLASEIPRLYDINETTILSNDCWKLIHWIFTFNSIELKLLNEKETKELYKDLKLNNERSIKILPNYIFKLNSPSARIRHNILKSENGSLQAFHGTKFENLYSIVHNGLINILNKRDAFGYGTYLSNLDVAITFSPYTYVKCNCSIKRLSSVLLCEIVRHSSIYIKENHSYYLVKDDDFLNVTHLFIYGEVEKNKNRWALEFHVILIIFGLIFLFYSIYKNNNKY